jgi:hypothetical protein
MGTKAQSIFYSPQKSTKATKMNLRFLSLFVAKDRSATIHHHANLARIAAALR